MKNHGGEDDYFAKPGPELQEPRKVVNLSPTRVRNQAEGDYFYFDSDSSTGGAVQNGKEYL